MDCVRAAWLTLGSLSVPLEDYDAGYFCTELDLGYPDVREVVSNKPDRDGTDDRTKFFGARAVTAAITAIAGAGAQIDAVASSFAPFMVPSARPQLHYILDRPGAAERVLTLRGSGYSWPVAGPFERDIQLAWVASDPVARDPNTRTATAWAGSSTTAGRAYPLTFNRIYPPGGGGPISAVFSSPGDLPILPLLRIYGPITAPQVQFSYQVPGGPFSVQSIWFNPGYLINAGHWVDVNMRDRTALVDSDPGQSAVSAITWGSSVWTPLPAAPYVITMALRGSGVTSGVTQCQASWQDGYLT